MNGDTKLKWRDALADLLREIESGHFPPGSSFYSLKQLCDRFDFSVITARRVFDELKSRGLLRTNGRRGAVVTGGVGAETVYLVLRPEELEAEENSVLHNRSVYAMMEGFRRPPFGRLFRITPVALDFCLSHPDSFRDAPMIMMQYALFEISEFKARLNRPLAHHVLETFNPIVFHTCLSIPGYTEVSIDMGAAIREMVDLLASRGHRKIAYFSSDVSGLWFRSRFRGYLDALEENELSFDPALLAITNDRGEDEAALERMLALTDPPTAMVCTNDTRALNLLAACRSRGICVPEELAVTGFGDFPEAALAIPPLTTHDPRDADMGAAVLDLLQKRREGNLEEPARVMIRPKLIYRQSHGERIPSAEKHTDKQ